MELARKGNRVVGTLGGDDEGRWTYSPGYPRSHSGYWTASFGIGAPMELSVERATQDHPGFRKAFIEFMKEYPEVINYRVNFDGNLFTARQLISAPIPPKSPNWSRIVFLHGTSEKAAENILKHGLIPRGVTGASPAYGRHSSAGESFSDRVYLTRQHQMASFASRDATKKGDGRRVILQVTGLKPSLVLPDEDSGLSDPRLSLWRLGSISYQGSVPPKNIRLAEVFVDGKWFDVKDAT